MFQIALYQPEIPPNTGNIMRLCANTGCMLHLIHPLGFKLEEKKLRRAGMDYRDLANVKEYNDYETFLTAVQNEVNNIYCITTKGSSHHHKAKFSKNDIFLFGPETRGLPDDILDVTASEHKIRLPMLEDSRSLNLSNSAAILVYEALRQQDFEGLA